MEFSGILSYLVFFLSLAGIYALLSLGLNIQWGFTGILNIGIAAFFAVGAYTSAILCTPAGGDPGGYGLPIAVGMIAAMITASILAFLVGLITVNLRSDYLAIASIGIAEIVRLILKNEEWLTNGVRGIAGIPKPFAGTLGSGADQLLYLALVVVLVLAAYWASQRAYRSPWGRVLRAIREKEIAASAMGKNTMVFRLQAFVLGSALMGLAGAVYAHFVGFISPEAFDPLFATFIVWVMLIAGGSGNNKGAILGAVVVWGVWSMSSFLTALLPPQYITQAAALRVFLIGLLLQVILLVRPEGLLPEVAPRAIVDRSRD